MEFVEGRSIDLIYSKEGPIEENKIQRYAYQMLLALQFAHKHKIIHRDIKGKNILVDNKDFIKLCDFGSAKTLGFLFFFYLSFCFFCFFLLFFCAPQINTQ